MKTPLIIISVVLLIIASILLYNWWTTEPFVSKREKAEAIAEIIPSKPSYLEYRDTIGSDVVEYIDVSRLSQPTVSNIEAVI